MKKKISIILDIIIVLSSGIGFYLTMFSSNFMNSKALLYYTVQSNIFILIICLFTLIYKLIDKEIPNYLCIIKYLCTVGITLTFLVFTFLLVPQMFGGYDPYLLSLGNITVHFLSPILSVVSFLFFEKVETRKYSYLYGTIMPIVYCAFIMILTLINKNPLFGVKNQLTRFPYFFMDYEANGWFSIGNSIWELGFVYWFLILFITVALISKVFLKINKSVMTNNK